MPPAEGSPTSSTASPDQLRSEAGWAVEVLALTGLAITQPLLHIFGGAPQQFAFRGATDLDIVGFALVVALVPAVGLWAAGAGSRLLGPRVRELAHLGTVAVLVAVFAVQALRSVLPGPVLFGSAMLAGGIVAVARHRLVPVRVWLRFLAVAPVVFVVLFLTGSATSGLLEETSALEPGRARTPAPVVMLVFDELPLASVVDERGRVDAELFPHLAGLADESHWFPDATTVASSTWHAAPALVTGRWPELGQAPVAVDHPESLFTLFGADHPLNVTESVTRLCPSELCGPSGTDGGGLRALVGDAARTLQGRLSWSGDTGDRVAALVEEVDGPPDEGGEPDGSGDDGWADFGLNQPARFSAFTDGIVDARPALHHLHVLLPHVPFRYLPSGLTYDGPTPDLGRVEEDLWGPDQTLADLGRHRHLLQVGYVDRLLGQVLSDLRAKGVYDEAMIVVTSDHGITFEADGPIRGIEGQELDATLMADVAWVPLVVKLPGQRSGTVIDRPVETIDIVPTIAEVVGLDLPWPVDGRSLFDLESPDRPRRFHPTDVTRFGIGFGDPIDPDVMVDPQTVWARGVARFLPAIGDPDRWWRTGPRPELVGRAVEEVAGLEPLDVEWPNVDLERVDPATGTVPALLRGEIAAGGPAAVGDPVVVAVNGTISASGTLHEADGSIRVAVMVPGESFGAGSNPVTLHRVPAP